MGEGDHRRRCMGLDPFHRRQYGFRKRRSTVDAITQVMKFADSCKKKRVICLMIAMDIKNAFNTLSWDGIIEEMIKRKLPWKIIRLISNYLTDRRIIANNQFGKVEYQIAAGLPQGSVLGLFLWNIVYDRLLERLHNRVLFKAIAFVDDDHRMTDDCA
jgi:retron-type reverse transcriptase